jgi:hypothetical protein
MEADLVVDTLEAVTPDDLEQTLESSRGRGIKGDRVAK